MSGNLYDTCLLQDRVMLEFSPLSQQLTSHINQLLTAAYTKFEVWQSRRKSAVLR